MSRTACGRSHAAHALDQVQGGEARHVPVDDDQVRRPLGYRKQSGIAVGDGAHREPLVRKLLTERFDGDDIPIYDEYLFIGIGGEHRRRAIRDTKLYNSLTLL